jgi:hypothetical protein
MAVSLYGMLFNNSKQSGNDLEICDLQELFEEEGECEDMKIIVHAYQRYGKTVKKPEVYEFCCWQSLWEWLEKGGCLYKCKKCKRAGRT